ncbi:hypothetical protein PAMA_020148 [Pampus argenteus]
MPFLCVACLPPHPHPTHTHTHTHTLPCPLFCTFTAHSSHPARTCTHFPPPASHESLLLSAKIEQRGKKQKTKTKKKHKKKTTTTIPSVSLSCSCVSDIHPGSTHEASMLRPHNMMSLMTPQLNSTLPPTTTTSSSSSSPPPTELNPTRINPSAGWLPTYCPASQPT